MNILSDTGFESHGVLNLSPRQCLELFNSGEAILVDVREEYMISSKMFRVDELICLPFSELEQLYDRLPSDKPLIFADAVGLKSRESVLFMKSHGYSNVANMAGGIVDWERDGLPVDTDRNEILSGSCMCQLRARSKKPKP